jgi:hypothetical protein
MNQQSQNQILSKIIELDLIITRSIINGHNPSENDQYKEQREELNTLRCVYFGYETKYCNKKGFKK